MASTSNNIINLDFIPNSLEQLSNYIDKHPDQDWLMPAVIILPFAAIFYKISKSNVTSKNTKHKNKKRIKNKK